MEEKCCLVFDVGKTNQKYFVLINCKGLGYEIQILESFFNKLKIE